MSIFQRAARAVAATIGACVLTFASPAPAYVVKHASSGAIARWQRSEVAFVMSSTIDKAAPGARDAVRRAAQTWSGVEPHVPTISISDSDEDGDVSPRYDGKNVIYFAEHGYPAAGRALAVTILSFDSQTGEILDSDIVLNGTHALEVLADGARGAAGARAVSTEGDGEDGEDGPPFDLVHVLAHEMGHALGLGDEPTDSSALMFPLTMPGDASMRAPRSDDVAGLDVIYAAPATTSSQHGCSIGGRSAGTTWPFGVFLAAATTMFIRRRMFFDHQKPIASGRLRQRGKR